MIIKGSKNKGTSFVLPVFIFFTLACLIAFLSFYLKTDPIEVSTSFIECDAEDLDGEYFIHNNHKFSGANLQSDKFSYNGKYSIELNSKNHRGFEHILKLPEPGATYKASVWKYSQNDDKGFIVAESKDGNSIFVENSEYETYTKDWWFLLQIYFTVPHDTLIEEIHIYATNKGVGTVFFDQLKIEKISTSDAKVDQHNIFNKSLALLIEQKSIEQLDNQKSKAISRGVFMQDEESEVPAAIIENTKKNKISLRFKGDWLDHILSTQPSYRIECKGDYTWNGMPSFSIQHPKTRGYMREWIYHDLLDHVQVLSPRYDFMNVSINGEQAKVYAFEEHFNKHLVEHKKRREGPIIKFTEDHFWEGVVRYREQNKGLPPITNKNDAFQDSDISPFKVSRTQKDSTLSKQFAVAKNLVNRYKYGEGKVRETFDIDKLARFMAISEICMAGHSLTWHNQRFYYNPVISLLEPVGFDCSLFGQDVQAMTKPLFIEESLVKRNDAIEPIVKLFSDQEFLTLFFTYLNKFSDPEFIQVYLSNRRQEINKRELLIKKLESNYSYNRSELVDRAKKIQITLEPKTNALKIYRQQVHGDSVVLRFINTHSLPLEIEILSNGETINDIILPHQERQIPRYYERTFGPERYTIKYRLPGSDNWQESTISPWSQPAFTAPRIELFETYNEIDTSLFFITNDDKIVMKEGSHIVNEPVVLPGKYTLYIQPGTKVEFVDNGMLVSSSRIQALGTSEAPILFKGNGKNGSLTILQAEGDSKMSHVWFDNQSTLIYKNWNLTGAVTFYESDITIDHCKFLNNTCEDALNIIRSTFKVSNSEFVNIYSDAFDADFCEGILSSSSFRNTGNDAIDFSTSVIEVTGCIMTQIGDKAISAGEQATIEAREISVSDANIAFASKDLSVLILRDVSITNCEKGFTAYQKKPEFGPATIQVYGQVNENVKNLFLIEEGSTLMK